MTALYDCVVQHARTDPIDNRFRYRSYSWLVDVDDLPRLPLLLRPCARFEARDHLGDPRASISANVRGWLARQGVDLTDGRILMLANARMLGHVFNPITVFWCYPAGHDRATHIVAEVHNTYGDRHAYLLQPDGEGRVEADKQLYVSPFYPADGHYRMHFSEPGGSLAMSIVYEAAGRRPFAASLHGSRQTLTPGTLLRLLLRYPWAPLRVSALIRYQGMKLWLRGLRPHRRPVHTAQEGVQ